MSRLLKSGEVQLHMPRTGGRSLAEQIGVEDFVGTMHDGIEQVPQEWKDYPVVATWRPPLSWRKSMSRYLSKIQNDHINYTFLCCRPNHCEFEFQNIDPTFGLWDDPKENFLNFILERNFRTWYEAYCDYFLSPADRIVPIHTLEVHKVEP